jgi:hypothetical protein
VPVRQYNGPTQYFAAGVPKLLNFNGTPYVYYSTVTANNGGNWQSISIRGVQLWESGGRMWTHGYTSPSFATEGDVEVWQTDPNDPISNQVADGGQVYTDGTEIYMTAMLGGTRGAPCLYSSGGDGIDSTHSVGCYRMAIGRSSSPLEVRAFNGVRVSDWDLPSNTMQYPRRFYDPNRGYMFWAGVYPVSPGAHPGPVFMPDPGMTAWSQGGNYTGTWAFRTAGNMNLGVGQTIYTANGILTYQSDGNFVLYNSWQNPVWATNTNGRCLGTCEHAVFQTDGNLVLYGSGGPYWATGTNPHGSYAVFGLSPAFYHMGIQNSSWQWIWGQ